MSAGFDAGGAWSVQFPDQQKGIKCGAVVAGHSWLSVEDAPEAVYLDTGDCFLLPSGRPFRLETDQGLSPVDANEIFIDARNGGIVSYNGGGEFFLVSSRFALMGNHADILLRMLPAIVHIQSDADQAATLRWSVERMMHELRDQNPGSILIIEHAAHMMLVQALRLYLAKGSNGGVGWLFALADKQMGSAIKAMHSDPAHGWTLQELGEHVGMSRSTFALRFKEIVGTTPMDYLTRWRMMMAGDKLASSGEPVSSIALSLGYESESAFSTAFKRVMGCSPRQYGRGLIRTSPSTNEKERSDSDPNDSPLRTDVVHSGIGELNRSTSKHFA